MPYLLGIDVGTSGTKALLMDSHGQVKGRVSADYPLHTPRPGWAEQDPDDWWKAAQRVIRQLLAQTEISPSDVAAVGLSGQMHSCVLLDSDHQLLRPAILWCDSRTTRQCQTMETMLGGRSRLLELTGNRCLEGFTAPKLLWVREHEPEVYSRIRTVLLPKDYVRFRLTGRLATDVSDAAGTLLFDVRRRRWSAEVMAALDLNPDWFPPAFESSAVCGHITQEASRATGLLEGTPVVAGGADNTCGAVGAGVVQPGRALVSIGSSGVIFVATGEPHTDPQGIVHSFVHSVPQQWYLMSVMLAAGLSFRWVRDHLGQLEHSIAPLLGADAYDLLAQEAQKAPAGSDGLFFLPYLQGERTPHADGNARGVWFGLAASHTRSHLIRSVMEGITYGLRDCLEPIRALGIEVPQLRALGGGARNRFWCQLQADILNVDIALLAVDEGPALGAALLAGVGAGVFPDVQTAADRCVALREVLRPDPQAAAAYAERFAFYQSLYPALKDRFARAASL